MIAPSKFQSYLQSLLGTSQEGTDWSGGNSSGNSLYCYISTLAESFTTNPQKQQEEQRQLFAVLDGLRNYAPEHVLLVGKPGSGKSTALRQLLSEEAEYCIVAIKQSNNEMPPIPVLIELCSLKGSVLRAIQEKLEWWFDLDEKTLKSLLRNRRLLVLLDGLNELPNDNAWKEVDKFKQVCTELKIPLIVTTRELSSGSNLGITRTLKMLSLTESQMQEFVHKRLPKTGDNLLQRIQGHLRELAETPLLLQILCDVFAEKGGIPKNRGDLFRKEFARRYEKFKPERFRNVSENSRRFTFNLLCYLAFVMVQGRPHTDPCKPTTPRITISKTQAEKILVTSLAGDRAPTLQETAAAKEWLEDLLEWHLLQVAKDPDHIEFHHQLFHDYYAAEQLVQQLSTLSNEQLKYYYLNYLKWTEPIALMLSLLDDQEQAVQVVRLAFSVDLKLGARLAGEVKPEFQTHTVRLIAELKVSLISKIWLFPIRRSIKIPLLLRVELLGITRSNAAIPALKRTLQNQDSFIREYAAKALGKIGSDEAISVLKSALNDKASFVRQEVADALNSIAGHDSPFEQMKDEFDSQRTVLSELIFLLAYGRIHEEASEALEDLPERLEDCDGEAVIRTLSWALQNNNPKTHLDAIQFLDSTNEILENTNLGYNPILTKDLVKITIETTITLLTQALQDTDPNVRLSAVEVLGKVDSDALIDPNALITPLIQALNDEYFEIRLRAAEALGKNGGRASTRLLTQALQNKDPNVRLRAVKALGKVDPDASIKPLIQALDDEYFEIRLRAAEALGKNGGEVSIALLTQTLQDKNPEVRQRAAEALGKIGNSQLLPHLLELLIKTILPRKSKAKMVAAQKKNKAIVVMRAELSDRFKEESEEERQATKWTHDTLGLSERVPITMSSMCVGHSYHFHIVVCNEIDSSISVIQEYCKHYLLPESNGWRWQLERFTLLTCAVSETDNRGKYTNIFSDISSAISGIQQQCQFYNYDIVQSSPPSLPKVKHSKLSTQGITNVTNKFNFDQRGAAIGVNIASEGSNIKFIQHAKQNIHISEQDLAEAVQKIQALLNQLAQTYPTTDEVQQQTFVQKFLEWVESTPGMIKVLLAGGIEGLKVLCPPAGIPVEMARRLYEAVQERHNQT